MSLETATNISQLDPSNPAATDRLAQGDDHIRLIKQTLKSTFPGITGPLSASVTQGFLNSLVAAVFPVGAITLYAGATAPVGWWLCNGSVATLSDGSGTFTTPDLRGRVPVGADATNPLGSLFGQYAKTVTAAASGAHTPSVALAAAPDHTHAITVEGHTLTTAEMPAHSHGSGITDVQAGTGPYGARPSPQGVDASLGGGTSTLQYVGETIGGDQSHTHTATGAVAGAHNHAVTTAPVEAHTHSVTIDTAQPSIAMNYIIKI